MKLLYIFQQPRSATSGLSIYDKRLSGALEDLGYTVERIALTESGPVAGYFGVLRRLPPAIARYQNANNALLVKQAIEDHRPEAVILSHESTLYLIEQSIVPRDRTAILCHNIMAPGYRSRGTLADTIYAGLFAGYEKRLARAGVPVTAISEYDRSAALAEYGFSMAALCPPGTLPGSQLVPHTARFEPSVTISGNYDWRLKRQDLMAFFEEFSASSVVDDLDLYLSAGAAKYAPAGLDYVEGLPARRDIGIGLVVDRFEAGFKLKVLEYISHGLAVASYCDLSSDFAGAPDADIFVRRINVASDIAAASADLARMDDLASRYRKFQDWVFAEYSWKRSAQALSEILEPEAGQQA